MKKSNKIKKNTHFLAFVAFLMLANQAYSAKTTFGMQVMISGHDHDNEYSQHHGHREQHIDHKLLRANKHISKMKPIDRKIYEYEQKIRRNKLHQGDIQIGKLRKMLKTVKVYHTMKEVRKINHDKTLQMLRYQPNRAAAIQLEINKRDHSKNGQSLADLLKAKSKSNPFKEVVALQTVIDDALAPVERQKEKERKEMEKQLAGRGMKGLLKSHKS
jgi:hypothetical protein